MMDATEKILDELNVPSSRYALNPQFRLREIAMRRIYANKLIFATGIIVILMSVLFALCRVHGGGIGHEGPSTSPLSSVVSRKCWRRAMCTRRSSHFHLTRWATGPRVTQNPSEEREIYLYFSPGPIIARPG